MKKTRSKSIKNVVVTKPDLRNIYMFLVRKADVDVKTAGEKRDSNWPDLQANRPTITVVSENSITTEADDDAIFDNDVLDLQKTVSIDLTYVNYRSKKSISVRLKESDSDASYRNLFSVSGEDPEWVDANFVELERIFAAIRPQSTLLHRLRWAVIVVLAVAIGYSWNEFLDIVLGPFKLRDEQPPAWVIYVREHELLRYFVLLIVEFGVGVFPSRALVSWLEKLWPVVEFDFGPEHLKTRKHLRGRLVVVITVLLLPFAIEVFKRYALKWR